DVAGGGGGRAVDRDPDRRGGPRAAVLRGAPGHARPGDAGRRQGAADCRGRLRARARGGGVRDTEGALTTVQQWSLVVLRTLIGWHFLYEGYFKLWRPAWTRSGAMLAPWSSAGYLRAANGPFADLFHRLAASGAL